MSIIKVSALTKNKVGKEAKVSQVQKHSESDFFERIVSLRLNL